jgi:hypothetical protein
MDNVSHREAFSRKVCFSRQLNGHAIFLDRGNKIVFATKHLVPETMRHGSVVLDGMVEYVSQLRPDTYERYGVGATESGWTYVEVFPGSSIAKPNEPPSFDTSGFLNFVWKNDSTGEPFWVVKYVHKSSEFLLDIVSREAAVKSVKSSEFFNAHSRSWPGQRG